MKLKFYKKSLKVAKIYKIKGDTRQTCIFCGLNIEDIPVIAIPMQTANYWGRNFTKDNHICPHCIEKMHNDLVTYSRKHISLRFMNNFKKLYQRTILMMGLKNPTKIAQVTEVVTAPTSEPKESEI